MNLDSKIDELYRLPLPEFTAARNALAKTLTGGEAKHVKALPKPTLVPWAVNQLYWNARAAYDRLMKSGDTLRSAQIAALKGRAGDMPRATEQHRKALAEAVREATRIGGAHGSHPGADELARMLEALSLASSRPEHPGRFVELVQPAGFEALAGVTPAGAGPARTGSSPPKGGHHVQQTPAGVVSAFRRPENEEARQRAEKAAAEKEEQEIARRRQEAEANLKAAEQALERARAAEARQREAFDRAQEERRDAEAALAATKRLSSKF